MIKKSQFPISKFQIFKIKLSKLNRKVYELILFISIFVYIVYFSYLSITRYETLNSHYYDLGIMHQVVHNTAKGRFLEMTNPTFFENMSRLAIHFDPILIFFSPLYLIFGSDPRILLISQTIIVSLGAMAVYLLGMIILKKKIWSLLFSILYLLHYQIARAVIFDFHAITLATTFLLFSFYFYQKKKLKFFNIFIFLTLLTKEHAGLVIFFYGLYLIFFSKDKKNGLICSFFGLTFFLMTTFVIIPHFRSEKHFALGYYDKLITSPGQFFSQLFSFDNTKYFLRLILPSFFVIFYPKALIIALPEFLINIASQNTNMRAVYFHYQSLIVPVLFYGLVKGFANFQKNNFNFWKKGVLIFFLIFNFYYFYLFYPLPIFVKEKAVYKPVSQATKNTIILWKNLLKDDEITISTTPKLAPFFSGRRYYYNFLFDPAFYSLGYSDEEIFHKKKDAYLKADYLIIYKNEIESLIKERASFKLYDKLRNDKDFKLIFEKGEIEVYKKIKV